MKINIIGRIRSGRVYYRQPIVSAAAPPSGFGDCLTYWRHGDPSSGFGGFGMLYHNEIFCEDFVCTAPRMDGGDFEGVVFCLYGFIHKIRKIPKNQGKLLTLRLLPPPPLPPAEKHPHLVLIPKFLYTKNAGLPCLL